MAATKVRCFFDTEVDGVPLGRIIFELFNDACPKTCENFRALCTGEKGIGKTTEKPLHYRNAKFHRVIKDFMVQAGDFSAGNGTGGESIYGGQFEDENFELKHDVPFLLSMANRGKDTNGSQFFITTQTASHLDGKHVVFGHVVSGQEVVVAIENLPVDNRSRPLQQAVISNCGELIMQRSGQLKTKEKKKKKKKTDGSDSEDDKKKKKKKKDKKHKRKKEKLSEGEIDDDDDADDITVNMTMPKGQDSIAIDNHYKPHPLASITVINPEDIPEVPKNRFLDRGYQNKTNDTTKDERQVPGRLKSKAANVQFYTRSGRKVKGRGSLRYRTPSRSRSRSVTPPHWRQAQRRTIPLDKYERQSEREMEREMEIDERRKKREERHRLLSDGDHSEGKDEEPWKSGNSGGMKSIITGDKFRVQSFEDDKTSKDWRIARAETSLENNKENYSKRSNEDLRQKLKDRLAHSSAKDYAEKKTFNAKDYDNLDLDDTPLDYEAENEDENMEDSESDSKTLEAAKVDSLKKKPISKPREKSKERISKKKNPERETKVEKRDRSRSRNGRSKSRDRRSRSRDGRSKGGNYRTNTRNGRGRSSDRGRRRSSDKPKDRKEDSRKRDRSSGRHKEKPSEKRSRKRDASSSSSKDN